MEEDDNLGYIPDEHDEIIINDFKEPKYESKHGSLKVSCDEEDIELYRKIIKLMLEEWKNKQN